jgi:hypothetical protein
MVLDLHVGFLQFVHGMTGGGTLPVCEELFPIRFLGKRLFSEAEAALGLG